MGSEVRPSHDTVRGPGDVEAPVSFGARLRRARRVADVTQQQLAEAVGATQPAVSYWESNRCEPSLTALVAISDLLGVSLDDLLGA